MKNWRYMLLIVLLLALYLYTRTDNVNTQVLARQSVPNHIVSYDDLQDLKGVSESVIQMQPVISVDLQVPQNKKLRLIPPITGYDDGYSSAYIVKSIVPGAYMVTIDSSVYRFESPEKAESAFSNIYIPQWASVDDKFLSPRLIKAMRKKGISWLIAKGISPVQHKTHYFIWLHWSGSPYVVHLGVISISIDTGALAATFDVSRASLDSITGKRLSRLLAELVRKEEDLKNVVDYSFASKVGNRWANRLVEHMLNESTY